MTSFRNFLITFLVSALLFGVIGYFMTVFVSGVVEGLIESGNASSENKTEDGSGDNPGVSPFEKEPEGNSYSFLIVLTDYDPVYHNDYVPTDWEAGSISSYVGTSGSDLGLLLKKSRHVHATAIILVKADKEKREYLLSYLSPETRVYTRSGAATLGNVYGNYGVNILKQHVKALTGIDVDYHFIIDGYRLSEVLDSFGRTSVDLSSDVYEFGEYYMTSYNFSAEEKKAAFDPDPVPEETEKAGETESYVEEIVPVPTIERALFAGTHELSGKALAVLSELKECCLDDVSLKGEYVLSTVEYYLKKFGQITESELTDKLYSLTENTPYAADSSLDIKPAVASDFTVPDVATHRGMIEAITYFDVKKIVYPGNYVATHDADIGYYVPTLRVAIEDLIDYR